MHRTIEAIYEEDGRLRPLSPLRLIKRDQVRIDFEETPSDSDARQTLRALDDLLEACSELSPEQWDLFDEATRRGPFFRASESSD